MIRLVAAYGRPPASQGRACALRAEPPEESQAEPLVPDARMTATDLRATLGLAFPPQLQSIRNIQDAVAEFYGINPAYMRKPDGEGAREARIARPRQVAMFFARKFTNQPLTDIGRRFNRDHSTVIHAVRAVEKRAAQDPFLEMELEVLRERLSA